MFICGIHATILIVHGHIGVWHSRGLLWQHSTIRIHNVPAEVGNVQWVLLSLVEQVFGVAYDSMKVVELFALVVLGAAPYLVVWLVSQIGWGHMCLIVW